MFELFWPWAATPRPIKSGGFGVYVLGFRIKGRNLTWGEGSSSEFHLMERSTTGSTFDPLT
jgi:hypothetical protein